MDAAVGGTDLDGMLVTSLNLFPSSAHLLTSLLSRADKLSPAPPLSRDWSKKMDDEVGEIEDLG